MTSKEYWSRWGCYKSALSRSDSTVQGRKKETKEKLFSRQDFYLLGVGLDHDVAVDEDGADDGAREEGVGEHVDGDPGRQHYEDVEEEEEESLNSGLCPIR